VIDLLGIDQDSTIWAIVTTAGFLVSAVVAFVLGNRRAKLGEIQSIIDTLQEERSHWKSSFENLEVVREELKKEIYDMRNEIDRLNAKLVIMESGHSDMPFPVWLKDSDGRMMYLNEAYEKMFLRPMGLTREDYIGKYDTDIWDKETAEHFKVNDDLAKTSETGSYRTYEEVLVSRDGHHKFETVEVLKYLRFYGGVIIGVGGLIIPPKDSDIIRH